MVLNKAQLNLEPLQRKAIKSPLDNGRGVEWKNMAAVICRGETGTAEIKRRIALV